MAPGDPPGGVPAAGVSESDGGNNYWGSPAVNPGLFIPEMENDWVGVPYREGMRILSHEHPLNQHNCPQLPPNFKLFLKMNT